jgi:lysophospholipase L1-like esterase
VSNPWVSTLLSALNALDNPDKLWEENSPRGWSVGGATAAVIAAGIDTNIALHDNIDGLTRNVFLINIGANDVSALDETQYKLNYQYIIDALVSKWPDAEIFLAKSWRRGYTSECNTLAGWIDALIAANPTTCFLGHDERVWLEGGNDGTTMTTDGIHYSAAGQAECANQWKTILGY